MELGIVDKIDDIVRQAFCCPCPKVGGCVEPCAIHNKALASARLAAALVLEGAQDSSVWRLPGYLRDGVRELRQGVVPICDNCLRPWDRLVGNGPCPRCGGRAITA
jgi:hypothetical protein